MTTKRRPTITITRSQFAEMIKQVRGTTMISLLMASEPTWKGKSSENPYIGKVLKIQKWSGCIGYDYQANVNAQLFREGQTADFVAEKRAWGVRVGDTPIVENKGKTYLDCRVFKALDVKFRMGGKKISRETLSQWLKPTSHSQRQGTEKETVVRTPEITHIIKCRMQGAEYRLVND